MATHQLQVRCRRVKVRRSETNVLPLSYTASVWRSATTTTDRPHYIISLILLLLYYFWCWRHCWNCFIKRTTGRATCVCDCHSPAHAINTAKLTTSANNWRLAGRSLARVIKEGVLFRGRPAATMQMRVRGRISEAWRKLADHPGSAALINTRALWLAIEFR